MKVLYLIRKEPDETLKVLLAEQGRENDVAVVDLRGEIDYGSVVDLIALSEKVISW